MQGTTHCGAINKSLELPWASNNRYFFQLIIIINMSPIFDERFGFNSWRAWLMVPIYLISHKKYTPSIRLVCKMPILLEKGKIKTFIRN